MDIFNKLLDRKDFKENVNWTRKHYKSNDQIISQGEVDNTIYLVSKGTVRVLGLVELDECKKVKPGVYDIKEGEVFGELVLFDQEPRSATVICVTDCEVIAINGGKLLEYMQQNTDLGFEFMQELMCFMVERLRNANNKIFSLMSWGLKVHRIDKYID